MFGVNSLQSSTELSLKNSLLQKPDPTDADVSIFEMVNDPTKKIEDQNILTAAAEKVKSQNQEMIKNALNEMAQSFTEEVQARIMQNALYVSNKKFRLNLADIVSLPSLTGVNGGVVKFSMNGITEKGISISGSVNDIANTDLGGILAGRMVMARAAINIPISDDVKKKEVMKYLEAKNYTQVVQSMEPGEAVLEYDQKTGEPVILAIKGVDGSVTIIIDKEGMQMTVKLSSSDKNFDKLTESTPESKTSEKN